MKSFSVSKSNIYFHTKSGRSISFTINTTNRSKKSGGNYTKQRTEKGHHTAALRKRFKNNTSSPSRKENGKNFHRFHCHKNFTESRACRLHTFHHFTNPFFLSLSLSLPQNVEIGQYE